jgi:cytochrome c2
LRAEHFSWSGARLDQWLADPQVAVPGAKMPIHVADERDRRDIIAYLRLVTEQSQAATGVTAIR